MRKGGKRRVVGARAHAALIVVAAASPATVQAQVTMPLIVPTPVSATLTGGRIDLGRSIMLVAAPGTEADTVALVRRILSDAGVERIEAATHLSAAAGRSQVVIGLAGTAPVRAALARSGAAAETAPEGYTLASVDTGAGALVTLAGHDADGLFHAAQTLRQLASRAVFPALVIRDRPAMPIRGTIEGFYGRPWSMADRAAHLDFLGQVKANSYIYSPKDDPYARDRWREDYPAATLAALGDLAARARQNHVTFVYAISPGPTVCFSDPNDHRALMRKVDALRTTGVRSFYVALDDIEYTKWNCDADRAAFGEPGAEAAGVAQSRLLNAVQADLAARRYTASALMMVPTEYYDAKESPYKAALRRHLDPRIVVQWTGTDVVPPAISVADARAAAKVFGRRTLLWDNYPVNDFATSAGRLLMAPYARREAGLSADLSGIVANPMNQEAPSRVAVAGVAAFGWNDRAYDAERVWTWTAAALADGDGQVAAALLRFFDTQHLAPTFGSQPWQEQAPALKAVLDRVRIAIAGDDGPARRRALAELAATAEAIAAAPDIIRAGVADPGFAAQSAPWLDAMQRWGRALRLTAAGLDAADRGSGGAARFFAEAGRLAAEAAATRTITGATRFGGPAKVADGVLDRFVADAPTLIAPADRLSPPAAADRGATP